MKLQQLETDSQLDIPREVGRNIKALAQDPNYATAWRFIVDSLSGIRRLSFVPGVPEATELMLWREGRRFVGEWLQRIADAPMKDPPEPPAPPARTMTEKARRRATKPATTGNK